MRALPIKSEDIDEILGLDVANPELAELWGWHAEKMRLFMVGMELAFRELAGEKLADSSGQKGACLVLRNDAGILIGVIFGHLDVEDDTRLEVGGLTVAHNVDRKAARTALVEALLAQAETVGFTSVHFGCPTQDMADDFAACGFHQTAIVMSMYLEEE